MRRIPVVLCVLVTAVIAATVLAVTRGSFGGAQLLVWHDEFDGTMGSAPSASNWTYAVGGDGWGNAELECYTDSRDNSALDGHGNLIITARSDPGHACVGGTTNDYTSARLLTQNLRTIEYGHVRVRAKLPTAAGTWPAIWALGADHDTVGWPKSGEIDIVEKVGSMPDVAHGTVHGPDPSGAPFSITAKHVESGVPGGTFHVYGIDWTKDAIAFSVDDVVYNTVTRSDVDAKGGWSYDQPFYLLLNLAVGGQWPGPPTSDTTWPQRMVVDYVRVYR